MEVITYATAQELATQFAWFMTDYIKKKNDKVYIALSGGSTPKLLFACLAEQYSKSIDWSKVHLYWGDERCVAPDHADSNYKMTKDFLLSKISIPQENIHRLLGEADPAAEAQRYSEELLKTVPVKDGLPIFDILMLGMGDDGHTLSVFPSNIELMQSSKLCEVAVHPVSGQKRVTLTGKVANAAQVIAFLVTGANKADKVFEIHRQQKDWKLYPASYVRANQGKLYWFIDQEAAAKLS